MRVVIFTVTLLIIGCAGEPMPHATAATTILAKVPPKPPAVNPIRADGKIDTEALANAKKLGFTPVDKEGQVLYCRNDLKTGSRVERETVCLTSAQIDDLREKTKQSMSDLARRGRPPSPN